MRVIDLPIAGVTTGIFGINLLRSCRPPDVRRGILELGAIHVGKFGSFNSPRGDRFGSSLSGGDDGMVHLPASRQNLSG